MHSKHEQHGLGLDYERYGLNIYEVVTVMHLERKRYDGWGRDALVTVCT